MKTPIIETERIILRPLSVNDASNIFERWTSDELVSKYMRWCTHNNVEETKAWLAMEEANIDSEHVYQWGFELKKVIFYLVVEVFIIFKQREYLS
jgi:ribosomal-protein-alanine N-acetyltransferase